AYVPPSEIAAPRRIAPMSTATVTSTRPTLRWELGEGSDGARVELCRDRAMSDGCASFDASGSDGMPADALDPGIWFWRLRGMRGANVGDTEGPIWEFRVGFE